jgi:hypothetical protein
MAEQDRPNWQELTWVEVRAADGSTVRVFTDGSWCSAW